MFSKFVLNRVPSSAAWALFLLLSTASAGVAQSSRVVINEIMYAPVSPEPEWIELFNPDTSNVNIAGWQIFTLTKSVTLPIDSLTADQYSRYIVVTKDSAALRAKRPGNYPIVQCALPPLVNTGDAIVLKNASLQTVDSLYYMPSWGGSKGQSLERRNYLGSSTDPANWGTSVVPSGATPGELNSLSVPKAGAYDLALDSLQHSFTGDTLKIGVRVVNRGTLPIDSSILTVESDSGNGQSVVFTATLGRLDSGSSITEHIMLPHVSYRQTNYTIYITSALDTTHSDDTLRYYAPRGVKPLSVVMNEIMFAPVSPEPEWIEILNTSQDTIDIDSLRVTVKNNSAKAISSANTAIPPDSMIVITSNAATLATARNIPLNRIVTFALPSLINSRSTIAFSDERGNLIDSVIYEGNWISKDGISIEQIDPSRVGYDSTNWHACIDPSGSTILKPNSILPKNYDIALMKPMPFDDSLQLTLVYLGKETVRKTAISVVVGTLDTIEYPISCNLPPHDSLQVFIPLPQNFFGHFPAFANIVDTLDEQHENDSARFDIAAPIPPDSLVINEIMFNPKVGGCQWLEILNLSTRWISMDSVRLLVGESKPDAYSSTLPALLIPADSFGLISANDSVFKTWPYLTGRSSVISLDKSTLYFGKDSSSIVLHNFDSTTIDSLLYLKSWQSSLLIKVFTGISLERKDVLGPGNDRANWQACIDTSGGTPLEPNSTTTSTLPPTIQPSQTFQASFDPNPFSPDGDGFQDVSTLTVQTGDASTWALRVRIFDARGNTVRTLTDASTVVSAITLTFDGKRDNGQILTPGIYTALIELTSQSPVQSLKKAIGVAIAGKRR
jgi:hypothetical protein